MFSSAILIVLGNEAQARTPMVYYDSTSQKATDLSQYPEDYLDAVAEELNDRPRMTLEYDKPSERILKLLA
ncbi:transposase-like protein [Corynebacterium diphtheriae 31A]|nr:transposase-like protein [Corynebacterium diphtheriae 31A]